MKVDEMGWHMCHASKINLYIHCLVGTSEGNRLLGKPMCRWANNIKIDLEDKG
jgi:hypothetical protein